MQASEQLHGCTGDTIFLEDATATTFQVGTLTVCFETTGALTAPEREQVAYVHHVWLLNGNIGEIDMTVGGNRHDIPLRLDDGFYVLLKPLDIGLTYNFTVVPVLLK
jgi:hypothetical protein